MRGSITGRALREILHERGLVGEPQGLVSYGVSLDRTLPTLNANAGRVNKWQELGILKDRGLPVPPFALDAEELSFPVLGRKRNHTRGRDIVPILAKDSDYEYRKNGGHFDFVVQYVARRTEFRVWSYRRRHLATYEKVFRYPEQYRRIGCAADNGFAFEYVREPQEELKDLGGRAVDALDLDFGAVDILQSVDGRYYVLEVNTAPGVEGPRHGLIKLADKIQRWIELGYPRRNGDGN